MIWVYLAGQFVSAFATVVLCQRMSPPKDSALRALWRDVWLPLLLVLPCFGFVPIALPDVGGVGWVALGGPIAVAWVCVAAALFVGRSRDDTMRLAPGDAVYWALAGAVLVLLGAAHELHIWVGQCALALGAILLWRNTPGQSTHHNQVGHIEHHEILRGNVALSLSVLCALAHAVLAWLAVASAMHEAQTSPALRAMIVSAGMTIAVGAAIAAVVGLARRFNAVELTRLGGWAGTYGVLLAIGLFSLIGLLPQTITALTGRAIAPPRLHVAYGFGQYGLEATLLLVLAIWSLAWATGVKPHPMTARRGVGVGVGMAMAALVVWRVFRAVNALL